MIWWRTERLVKQLRAGAVGAPSQFGYVVAFVILELFSWAVDTIPWRAPELTALEGGVILIIKVFGPLLCFFANGGASGRDFVVRYIALSLPARVRAVVYLTVGLLPVAAVTGFTRGFFGLPAEWSWKAIAVGYFFVGANAIHLGVVVLALRRLRQPERALGRRSPVEPAAA